MSEDKLTEKEKEELLTLQKLQQQAQTLMYQKQTIELEAIEINNALREVEKNNTNDIYQIVGNIMIKKDKENILKFLKNRKELLDIRINSYDKQIKRINEDVNKIQSKLFTKRK